MGIYTVIEINSGWAIFYSDEFTQDSFVAGHLSKKQAEKWCDRLNIAYRSGFSYGSY